MAALDREPNVLQCKTETIHKHFLLTHRQLWTRDIDQQPFPMVLPDWLLPLLSPPPLEQVAARNAVR